VEQVIQQFDMALVEFRTTQSLLGRYSGINPSRVSRCLTGETPFTAEESRAVAATIAAMRELQSTVPHKLPLDWSQFGRIQPLVKTIREQVKDKMDPMLPKYCIVRIGLNFFSRITNNEVMTRPDQVSCSCFEDPSVAGQVVSKLFLMGRKADVVVVPLMRRRSETVQQLAEVGFTEASDVA
jgi:hypothetical protein